MSDNTLTTLMGHVPSRYGSPSWNVIPHIQFILVSRCILLLEDLDAAFTRSVSRDASSTGAPTASNTNSTTTTETNDGSTLSLSGLLNSLDGVAAAEGRWVAMTSHHNLVTNMPYLDYFLQRLTILSALIQHSVAQGAWMSG